MSYLLKKYVLMHSHIIILQMKFTLGLFAILAIIGLGQAGHQFPDFGEGPLHEDLQDIFDKIPLKRIARVVVGYVKYDREVQDFIKELSDPTLIKNLVAEFQAIPEVTKLFDYLHKEGIHVYSIINSINKALKIKELVPPSSQEYSIKRFGLRGLFKDIKWHIDYDDYISIYVNKLKTSTVFVNFIDQLKSDNFQQIVNKFFEIKSFQFIINYLDAKSVNLKIVSDITYLVLGIDVPILPTKTLVEELVDFVNLLPVEELVTKIIEYVNEDEKVAKAIKYLFTPEFHDLLREVEALKEHQALVTYLENVGLPVIAAIQEFHRAIDMEEYVPPKVKKLLESQIKTQKIGDGIQGLLKDVYDLLPLDKIDALFEEKIKTSKVFVDFIAKITSKQFFKIINNLITHETYKKFITKTIENGFDFEGIANLNTRIIGLKPVF